LKFVPETKNKSLEEIEEKWLAGKKGELETIDTAPEKTAN
jgi:SP family xylose:H+ symportor-like MFS transporter